MDKVELYKDLVSVTDVREKYNEYYERCRKEKKKLDELCWKQVELFLKFIGFRKKEDGFFDEWERVRDDGVRETIEIGRKYFGLFLRGNYKMDEIDDIVDWINGDGVMTVSSNGVGARTQEWDCVDILEFLWEYYESEFAELEEEIVGDAV